MAEKNLNKTITELMRKHEHIRNIGIVAHIDHGKTTLTDTLLAGAGMLSEALAGTACVMDFDPQEKERGITIYAANASMVHSFNKHDYLINLIDTPGHVDFGGDVTRAMRAVDGVIVLSDAVEGIMPQTETVVRQALRERVKPILFINKVDRLMNELKLTPEQMQQRFLNIIQGVNNLIQKYAEEEYKTKWLVNINDGSVAFGSAKKKWAISVPLMKEAGISFKDIIDFTNAGREEELAKRAPLYKVILDMVIRHLPNPEQAQKYRVPKLWPGDMGSEDGKSMLACNPDGPLAAVISKVYPTQHSGYVATVRIFSGKIVAGQEVLLIGKGSTARVQQVGVYRGQQRLAVDEVDAGNIVGVVGLKDASSGETLCSPDHKIPGFEAIKHIFEPVVTKAIEPKKPQDLTRLVEFLRKAAREDTTLQIKINEETGEYLVSGLGELHLDAKVERKLKDEGIDVTISPPIVIYNESVKSMTKEAVEGKSPNKHNRFYVIAAPLEKSVYDAMVNGEVPADIEVKGKKDQNLVENLVKHGMDRDQAKSVKLIHNKSVFMEMTRGVTAILEVMELCKEAFKESMDEGPLAREPCAATKIILVDAKLHEDTIHRGPAQVIPAMRRAIRGAMVKGGAYILEPKQIIRIDVPTEQMGGATREVGNRRGQIKDMTEERGVTSITTKIPVADMFGFNSALKSATGGLGFFWLIDIVYEPLPRELQDKVVRQIRERKGLTEEQMRVDEDEDE
jgi:elongation factor 2